MPKERLSQELSKKIEHEKNTRTYADLAFADDMVIRREPNKTPLRSGGLILPRISTGSCTVLIITATRIRRKFFP